MTQQNGNQFDDDLTVGLEDDGAFSTDSIDLFEFSGGDESPIARLKTIILSIDWEINDDILQQLEDELVDLSDIWADDKIKLVYIQGLRKIGKYIDKEKADAHPNSIKLLITFYHNLEKIVSADNEMSEDEKKKLLLADVEKFDQLKTQIGQPSTASKKVATVAYANPIEVTNDDDGADELKVLKAQVLGIDWEIDDDELEKLGDEVKRLESVYSSSKGKLILLQGIGALSSYIKKMKSKSNSKAFTLLHSFLEVLEKTPSGDLSSDEEKQLLLSEVEKFKSFKAEISQGQVEPEPIASVVESTPEVIPEVSREVLPVEDDDSEEISSDVESRLSSVFGDTDDESGSISTDKSAALEGVDVETDADDDSDEEALPFYDGSVAPALAEVDEESSFSVEKLAGDLASSFEPDEQDEEQLFGDEVLPGVDVESEADDDSDEEALPFVDGEIAPALSGSFDESGFEETERFDDVDDSDSYDLDSKLGSFFDDEVQSSSKEWGGEQEDDSEIEDDDELHVAALSGVTDDIEELIKEEISSEETDSDFLDDGALAPALSESEESLPLDIPIEDTVEEKLSFFDEDVVAPELDEPSEDIAEDEVSHEKAAEAQLSFLDEDISEATDLEEIFEDDIDSDEEVAEFFDEGAPVSALSETEDSIFEDEAEAIEETADDQLSFLDEDIPTPDTPEVEETFFEEETDVVEAVDEKLSFFDDETPAPALNGDFEEDSEESVFDTIEEDVLEEKLATEENIEEVVLEEEPSAEEENIEEVILEEELPAEEEDIEEVVLEEEPSAEEEDIEEVILEEQLPAEEETFEEELSFLDEKPDTAEIEDDAEETAEISAGDESEELFDTEEIEFTVPGEIATAGVVATAGVASLTDEKESFDDVIDFQVPGEDDSTGISLDVTEEFDTEEVVFEAVEDDVEVDPLPGEEFADSTVEERVEEETVEFLVAEDVDSQSDSVIDDKKELAPMDYSSLSSAIKQLQGEATDTNLQALLVETNKVRNQSTSNATGKIFLQLLSTISQHIERNIDEPDFRSLSLMDDVYSGLQMCSSSDVSTEQIQQQLLTCTSQVIFLQQKDIVKAEATTTLSGVEADADVPDQQQEDKIDTAAPSSMDDEKLVSFVQGELADIKELFLEEIRTLRKEVVDK